ncbi:MAG: ABC transporter permease subunit [Burkholderiales bacterium]|nr:ABC transporter permease subunit [Burkholderiales bacterium]
MIFTLAGKELRSLFASALAWIVLAVLQLILAWVFLMRLDGFFEVQPRLAHLANAPGATELVVAPLFSAAAVVLMMATPLLGMRLIAEERRNRTMTLLVSAPISMTQIVLGKFLGLVAFLAVPIGLVAAMALALMAGGTLDLGLLAANALGLALLLATFAAVGVFTSSLTRQPIIAAVLALGLLLASWLASLANPDPNHVMQLVSITRRFESFNAGMVDSADVAWHVLAICMFIGLTIRQLDRERLVGQPT